VPSAASSRTRSVRCMLHSLATCARSSSCTPRVTTGWRRRRITSLPLKLAVRGVVHPLKVACRRLELASTSSPPAEGPHPLIFFTLRRRSRRCRPSSAPAPRSPRPSPLDLRPRRRTISRPRSQFERVGAPYSSVVKRPTSDQPRSPASARARRRTAPACGAHSRLRRASLATAVASPS
jgi:hypothetical protein